MRVSQGEYDHAFALHFGAVSDANDLEVASPAAGYAFDGVVYQSTREAVNRCLRIILTDCDEMSVLLLDLDSGGQRCIELALRSLDRNCVAFDFYRNPFW